MGDNQGKEVEALRSRVRRLEALIRVLHPEARDLIEGEERPTRPVLRVIRGGKGGVAAFLAGAVVLMQWGRARPVRVGLAVVTVGTAATLTAFALALPNAQPPSAGLKPLPNVTAPAPPHHAVRPPAPKPDPSPVEVHPALAAVPAPPPGRPRPSAQPTRPVPTIPTSSQPVTWPFSPPPASPSPMPSTTPHFPAPPAPPSCVLDLNLVIIGVCVGG